MFFKHTRTLLAWLKYFQKFLLCFNKISFIKEFLREKLQFNNRIKQNIYDNYTRFCNFIMF